MATRKIKDAKDLSTNDLIYFKGHAQATFMSDGRTVEEAINDIDLSDKQDKINDLDKIRSGASKGATSAQQEELQTGASAVVVPDGVFVDGGGSTYALPDVAETTKEASDYVLATEDYVDSKVESASGGTVDEQVNLGEITEDTIYVKKNKTYHCIVKHLSEIWIDIDLNLGEMATLIMDMQTTCRVTLTGCSWGNDKEPNFDVGKTYEISIRRSFNTNNDLLAIFTEYNTGLSGTEPA